MLMTRYGKGSLIRYGSSKAPFPIVHFDISFSLFSRYFQFFERWLTRLFFLQAVNAVLYQVIYFLKFFLNLVHITRQAIYV